MNFEELKKEWTKEYPESANKIAEEQMQKFFSYMELLLEWNQKMNLTAITDPKEIILKHFIDSMTISPYIEEEKK